MIPAKELRIGNAIIINGKIVPHIGWAEIYQIASYDDTKPSRRPFKVEPIPFSPEILERAGFRKIDSKLDPVVDEYELIVSIRSNKHVINIKIAKHEELTTWGVYLVNNFFASENFYYVHQLQNLYFTLTTGTELMFYL